VISRLRIGRPQSQFAGSAVAVGGAAVAIAIAVGLVISPPRGAVAPVLILIPALIGIVLGLAARDRDALSPIVPLGAIFALYYVGRPLYVMGSGRIGPTRAIEDRGVSAAIERYMGQSSWLMLCAFLVMAMGYYLATRHRPVDARQARAAATPQVDMRRAALVLGATAALAVGVYGMLIAQAGGIAAYINELSVRSDYFFGRAYLTVATVPLKVTLFVLIALLSTTRLSRGHRFALSCAVALVLIGDFLTGGRSAVVLGTGLPLLLLIHYGYRRVKPFELAIFIMLAVVFFVSVRVLTRDAVYAGATGAARTSLLSAAFKNLPETLVGGRDAIPFDSLERVVEGAAAGDAPQWGRTYFPIFTYPIPRSAWPGKPLGGANTWFTRRYFPGYYSAGRVETSVSLAGESYANFREPGLLVAFGLLGALVGWGYRRSRAASRPLVTAVYVLTFSYALTLVRGDAFHSVTSAATVVVLAVLAYSFIAHRGVFR
jgi:hypothetical protein